jgi:hypothetical protein
MQTLLGTKGSPVAAMKAHLQSVRKYVKQTTATTKETIRMRSTWWIYSGDPVKRERPSEHAVGVHSDP